MEELGRKPRGLLQRRGSLSNSIQAGLDALAVLGVAWLLISINPGYFEKSRYVILLLVLLGLMSVVYQHFAIYRVHAGFTAKTLALVKAWSLCFLGLFVIGFLTKEGVHYSRGFILSFYVFGLLAQVFLHGIFRVGYRHFIHSTAQIENAVIIGEGNLADYLKTKISSNPWLKQNVIGNVLLEDIPGQQHDPRSLLLGTVADLPEIIEKNNVKTVYIVTPLESSKTLEDIYFQLLDKHVAVHWVPNIFSLRLVNHSVKEIAGLPLLTLSETPLTGNRWLIKAIEDRVLASVILLMISPILLAVAIAIKLDSQGPVFFRQNRAGWNGTVFRIWKFRSMYVNNDAMGKQVKQAEKDDPRITRVGRFIRKTSLDELPQLFNVIAGDMSLVGPRPHAIQHDEEYSKRIFDYFARHNIKPGITGLAQVRGFRGETKDIDKMIQRIQSDIEYINHWSLSLDLEILLKSFKAFTGENAY